MLAKISDEGAKANCFCPFERLRFTLHTYTKPTGLLTAS
ncbi:hypothetical protein GPSY_1908 [Paraglaciecola psychrophila 170]|nr:hypothetical protein GPSY_1908 [Paraglaciecola psychrophila 170]